MCTTSLTKGKRAEFLVFEKLISLGCELFLPIIDQGVDAIIRKQDGACVAIQVKSVVAEDRAGCFNVDDLDDLRSKEKLFIVCVDMSKQKPEFWVIPARVFRKYANKSNLKEGYKRYTLDINARSQRYGNRLRSEILKENLDAWHILID